MEDVDTGTLRALATLAMRGGSPAGTTRVVAVDGPSGAGKTTLAAQLSAVLRQAPVVHMDDLYPGWDGLEAGVRRLVEEVLEPLSRREPARYRRYEWAVGELAEARVVPAAAPVLVVEGVGCGALACAPYLSLLVWVDAPADVRWARAMGRDGEGYGPYWQRWAAQEEQHFRKSGTRQRADVVLATGPDGGSGCLKPEG